MNVRRRLWGAGTIDARVLATNIVAAMFVAAMFVTTMFVGCATSSATAPPSRESDPAGSGSGGPPPSVAGSSPRSSPSSPTEPAVGSGGPSAEVPETAPAGQEEERDAQPRRLAWVNPARCLPSCTFRPEALEQVNDAGQADGHGKHQVASTAVAPLRALIRAARAAGHQVRVASAFRSYEEQARVFRTTKEKGRAARPGHSEHQLGTAIDMKLPTSAAITWLAEHAADHGFALSYPEGKQRITGYRPEPWHIRYVGPELAGEMRRRGWTTEELFRARPELSESGSCTHCPTALSRARCGRTTEAGTCEGHVLTWCYDGALATVDCALSKQTCGRGPGKAEHECVANGAGDQSGDDVNASAPAATMDAEAGAR